LVFCGAAHTPVQLVFNFIDMFCPTVQITVDMCYMDVNAASSIQEQIVYEFQRWQPVSSAVYDVLMSILVQSTIYQFSFLIANDAGLYVIMLQVVLWGSDYPGHLLPTDPGRYGGVSYRLGISRMF
jgi:hypothetical protein